MSANHSDCRYAIHVDRVPAAGTRYITFFYLVSGTKPQCESPYTSALEILLLTYLLAYLLT